MKKILKILKWFGIVLLGLLIIVSTILAITGIPKPSTITAEHVPRLPLSYGTEVLSAINQAQDFTSFSRWAPSGEYLHVYQLSGKIRSKLHTLDKPNGDAKLIKGIPNEARGVMSNPDPKKNYLIYIMDQGGDEQYQLYKLDLSDNSSTMLTNGEDKHRSFSFDSSGKKLVYTSNKRNKKDFDLYLMNPDEPQSEELLLEVEGTWFISSWSPESDKILISRYISVNENKAYMLDIQSKSLTPFDSDIEEAVSYSSSVFSKDGEKVYYTSDYDSEFKRLRMRDLNTGADSMLSAAIQWDISYIKSSEDGKFLGLSVNEGGVDQLILYDTEQGTFEKIEGLPIGNIRSIDFHPSKNMLGFNFSQAGWPIVYTYDIELKKLTQWSKPDPKENEFPAAEIIRYTTFDFDSLRGEQRKIEAFYYKPLASSPKPFPVVIDIHGGPEGQSKLGGSNRPIMNRGIAVIKPNVRGSVGYGKTFTKLDNGMLRENSVKDIGALLDWIAQQPELDANRVIVRGGSYGGYMALAAAVKYSDRLTGGIDVVGISNFVSFLKNTKDHRRDLRRVEYGDERIPEMKQFLEAISPRNQVDKIDIPLLIVQGKNDPRVPVTESLDMVKELKAMKKEVWYIEASDEGHGFKKPFNAMYAGMAELKFLETLLLESTEQ